jgi:hypothetical protein
MRIPLAVLSLTRLSISPIYRGALRGCLFYDKKEADKFDKVYNRGLGAIRDNR